MLAVGETAPYIGSWCGAWTSGERKKRPGSYPPFKDICMFQKCLLITHSLEFGLKVCWEFCNLLAGPTTVENKFSPIAMEEWEKDMDRQLRLFVQRSSQNVQVTLTTSISAGLRLTLSQVAHPALQYPQNSHAQEIVMILLPPCSS